MEPIIWPGQGENPVGLAPFGFFDDDIQYLSDAPKVADWCARRMGYPTVAIEMIDLHFYACFEEAIVEYSHQVNEFNIREHIIELQGRSTDLSLTGTSIATTPLPFLSVLSGEYGTEAGAGGFADWKTGSINVSSGSATYDLQNLWGATSESGNRLEIRRIFHQRAPAVARSFWFGDFYGSNSFLTSFGWGLGSGYGVGGYGGYAGGYSGYGGLGYPGYSYVLLPTFDTALRTQAVKFGDKWYRSQYSFELINNKLRLTPIPTNDFALWFHYTVYEERINTGSQFDSGSISDMHNVPYELQVYSDINSVGKRWIWEYALACAKDTLGMIRNKFQTIPIPNAEVTLDGATLRQEAVAEKQQLIEQLRESLGEMGLQKQLEKQRSNAENMMEIWKRVPIGIYIG